MTIYKDGVHADLNETFLVGDVADENVALARTAYKCLQVATNAVKVSSSMWCEFLLFPRILNVVIVAVLPREVL